MIVGNVKQLTAELVKRFGTLKAKKQALVDEEQIVVPKIKALMKTSDLVKKVVTKTEDERTQVTRTYGPKGSPYMLVHTRYQKKDVSWKEVAQNLFAELHDLDQDDKSFDRRWAKFEDSFDLKWEERLECEINPNNKT